MKKLFVLLALTFALNPAFCATLKEMDMPLGPKNKMGLGDLPENEVVEVKSKVENVKVKLKPAQKFEEKQAQSVVNSNLTYADLSLKNISNDILADLSEEEPTISGELDALWLGVAQKSETIKYAIYKLSNPDEDKPSDTILKKIIRPVASFSTIAGSAFSTNPFVASGALIGGNFLGGLTTGSKELNYKFSRVSDTDMVLLVRKIDKLQERLLENYVDYKKKKLIYERALKNVEEREKIYLASQKKPKEELIIADVYYRNAQNFAAKAKTQFWVARQALEQFAGTDALKQIEGKTEDGVKPDSLGTPAAVK